MPNLICPICRKDLGQSVSLLGLPHVGAIHKQAHVYQEVAKLLEKADEWPELAEHFEPLRKAAAL